MPRPPIDLEDLLVEMHRICGDTTYTKIESAEAYEEVAAIAEVNAHAIREEIAAEDEDAGVFPEERDTTITGRDCV